MNEREFVGALQSATIAYQPRFRNDDRPVVVEVAEQAHTPAGHALLCALANQLARAHRRLVFVGELERELLCRDPFGHERLAAASAGLAQEINPTIAVDVVERRPRAEAIATLGIGCGGELALGCRGWGALTGEGGGVEIGEERGDVWGALLASCLGAWFAFQRLIGERPRAARGYSLWEFGRATGGEGPEMGDPLDVGRVLQVGAGGVGAALGYWLGLIGIGGDWVVVDGDLVEVSNLNRQLLFTAADAGYPNDAPTNKAACTARRLGGGARASEHWYGEDGAVVEAAYDVVLALANEHGAREALQDRRPAVLLHATTSSNHQAQLHRHLAGRDDCIRCRIPGAAAKLRCGGGEVAGVPSDAALPYLSGLAGLLLGAALAQHSVGELARSDRNLRLVDLGGAEPSSQQLKAACRQGCRQRG